MTTLTAVPATSTNAYQTERGRAIAQALEPYRAGLPPELIELQESQVFPYLIPASIRTARDSRCSGVLLGREAPAFVKRGRRVTYRLSDVLEWLRQGTTYRNTAEAASALLSGASHVEAMAVEHSGGAA